MRSTMQPDSGKSGGFFRKVMHIVRGTSATEADAPPDPDSLTAREALQEVMARKRRNDAIRQQEFALLRQLRQRNQAIGQVHDAAAEREAEVLSSLLGQETRSTATLQKIDEIEAQMSGQWWRQPPAAGAAAAPHAAGRRGPARSWSRLPVLGEDSVVQPAAPSAEAAATVATEPPAIPTAAPVVAAAAVAVPVVVPSPAVRAFQPHPDLEEAAILFAHGDLEGARTRLLEQLVQSLSATPRDEDKVCRLWHAMLDWCRATGDEDTFEPLAIDYAEHFGRSAPLWSSLPARLGQTALAGAVRKDPGKRQFLWSSPALLTVGAVTALRASQEDAPQPWCMSWLRLVAIDDAALQPLTRLCTAWADSEGQFVLSDAGKLLQLLDQQTPVGESHRPAAWWLLRMAVLRLVHRMDAYEQVALDYCVTYEVSPPSWVEPACHCIVQEEGEADVSVLHEASLQSVQAVAVLPQAGAAPGAMPVGQGLAGVIEGDAQPWLDALGAQARRGQVLEISCANLIRLDFVAAGSVLNWAAEMQNHGHELRFTQLHQLVAEFFHIIGIHEHATVQAVAA